MSRREQTAFFVTPFVAALTWYAITLAQLGIVNGSVRWGPDVLAMALGAFTWGLVVAAAATLLLAVPLHRTAARTVGISLATALAGGFIVGVVLGAIASVLTPSLSRVFSPIHTIAIGLVTAAAWWHIAGRPRRTPAVGNAMPD